jgi:hypothetical protein
MRKDWMDHKLNALQKSLFEDRPAEFLFDVEKDPWETHNLANNPKYQVVLQKMRRQLANDILRSKDILFLPEYELELISKTTTPFQYRLSDKNYPIQEIFQAASLSGLRGKAIALQQVNLLKSTNKVVRYWAITGLRSQSPDVVKLFKTAIINSMKDEYPPVVITASAIAYQEFNHQLAEENLKKFSSSDQMHLALMAINYLLYIKNKEPFIDTIKSIHELKDRSYDVKAACLDFLGSLGLVPNTPNYEE